MLLRAEHAAWAADSVPRDERRGRHVVVLHNVHPDHSSSAPKTRLTVDCYRTVCFLRQLDELESQLFARGSSVNKVKNLVLDAVLSETLWVVFRLVKLHNAFNVFFLENWNIVFWTEVSIAVFVHSLVLGGAESQKLSWNDPIHVAVFHFFVILIILHIKALQRKPPCFDRKLECLETVQQGVLVGTRQVECVSERFELDVFERLESLLC